MIPTEVRKLSDEVTAIFHDNDGSVYCYDKDGNDVPYPDSWPLRIGDVRTFCRERNITYKR